MKWILTLVPALRSNVSARGPGLEASIDSNCEAESDPRGGRWRRSANPARISTNGLLYTRRDHPGPAVWSAAGADSAERRGRGSGRRAEYGFGGMTGPLFTGPLFTGGGNIPGRGAVIGARGRLPLLTWLQLLRGNPGIVGLRHHGDTRLRADRTVDHVRTRRAELHVVVLPGCSGASAASAGS